MGEQPDRLVFRLRPQTPHGFVEAELAVLQEGRGRLPLPNAFINVHGQVLPTLRLAQGGRQHAVLLAVAEVATVFPETLGDRFRLLIEDPVSPFSAGHYQLGPDQSTARCESSEAKGLPQTGAGGERSGDGYGGEGQ